jgi:Short C-terminal domain
MPGLLRGVARTAVIAGTATAVSNNVSRRQTNRWANQAATAAPPPEAYQQPAPPPPPAPAASGEDEVITRLERLAQLQSQGVLTPEEFAAQKAKILGG